MTLCGEIIWEANSCIIISDRIEGLRYSNQIRHTVKKKQSQENAEALLFLRHLTNG